MKTQCAHCKKSFDDFESYARHILEKHKDDKIRVAWANEILNPTVPEETSKPKRRRRFPFRFGRQVEALAPPDDIKALRRAPKYIKKQYKDADVPLK